MTGGVDPSRAGRISGVGSALVGEFGRPGQHGHELHRLGVFALSASLIGDTIFILERRTAYSTRIACHKNKNELHAGAFLSPSVHTVLSNHAPVET